MAAVKIWRPRVMVKSSSVDHTALSITDRWQRALSIAVTWHTYKFDADEYEHKCVVSDDYKEEMMTEFQIMFSLVLFIDAIFLI